MKKIRKRETKRIRKIRKRKNRKRKKGKEVKEMISKTFDKNLKIISTKSFISITSNANPK